MALIRKRALRRGHCNLGGPARSESSPYTSQMPQRVLVKSTGKKVGQRRAARLILVLSCQISWLQSAHVVIRAPRRKSGRGDSGNGAA